MVLPKQIRSRVAQLHANLEELTPWVHGIRTLDMPIDDHMKEDLRVRLLIPVREFLGVLDHFEDQDAVGWYRDTVDGTRHDLEVLGGEPGYKLNSNPYCVVRIDRTSHSDAMWSMAVGRIFDSAKTCMENFLIERCIER